MITQTKRLFYLDLVRAVALGCILVVHFNATVTGYFTLPHKLFTSTLPLGIYLGDFGSSLFFMVSGAALGYTVPPDTTAKDFYIKRAGALYPMFWLAWVLCFSVRFVTRPGYYAAAPTWSFLLTVLGLDSFAVSAGWVGQSFACVGEWFLGTLLLLYLLFPVLQRALRRHPLLCWVVVLTVCLPLELSGIDRQLVAVHVPEFLFGMSFLTLTHRQKAVAAGICMVAAVLVQGDTKIICALFSAVAFTVLSLAAPLLEKAPMRRLGSWLSRYSYPLFLVHHVIILRLAEGFDLAALSHRDTAILFCIYLLFSFTAAVLLERLCRNLLSIVQKSCR